jgi:hypothetical protein
MKRLLLFAIFVAMGFFALAHSYFIASTGIVLAGLAAAGLVLYIVIGSNGRR